MSLQSDPTDSESVSDMQNKELEWNAFMWCNEEETNIPCANIYYYTNKCAYN